MPRSTRSKRIRRRHFRVFCFRRGTETVQGLSPGQRLLQALGRGRVRQVRQLHRRRGQRDAVSARSDLRRLDEHLHLVDGQQATVHDDQKR